MGEAYEGGGLAWLLGVRGAFQGQDFSPPHPS